MGIHRVVVLPYIRSSIVVPGAIPKLYEKTVICIPGRAHIAGNPEDVLAIAAANSIAGIDQFIGQFLNFCFLVCSPYGSSQPGICVLPGHRDPGMHIPQQVYPRKK